MRMKDTIRLTKAALQQPWLYREEELFYMRKAKQVVKKGLKLKQMRGMNGESEVGAGNT